jgi:hypothetical protein
MPSLPRLSRAAWRILIRTGRRSGDPAMGSMGYLAANARRYLNGYAWRRATGAAPVKRAA